MNDDPVEMPYRLFAFLAGCLIFTLSYINRTTFPLPWNDETRFYLPALWWAEHFSLSPINLHAPQGIFWVPDGFTVFVGIALRCFGETIQVARGLCEFSVALGVTLFAFGFRKLGGSWQTGVLTTLFLLTPPVVFAANMVRMEAPLFLLISLALLLHLQQKVLAASALLAGSLLLHPALGIAAVGYIVIVLMTRDKTAPKIIPTPFERLIVMLAAALVLAELFRIARHWHLFELHMAYQISRKTHMPLRAKLVKPQGLILFASFCIVAVLGRCYASQKRSDLHCVLPVVGIALGILTYAVYGSEMAYDVYSVSVCPAILYCLLCRNFLRRKASSVGNDRISSGAT